MPLDLSIAVNRKQLATRIQDAIDLYCVNKYNDGPRNHLGASLIGHECKAYLWYQFRWIKHKIFDARMYRLFQRGHLEELRYIEYLKGIGFNVWTVDDNGKQFRCAAVNGHFGGSLDGRAALPAEFDVAETMLLEFKTHNTGSHWANLMASGIAKNKPQHYIQASTYGRFYGIQYALYFSTNKNDDDMYIEVVKLDWSLADASVKKAEIIINSQTRPARVSESEAYQTCKYCDFLGPCHRHEPIDKNCRSCHNATPFEKGQWYCTRFAEVIPPDFIPKGCDQYRPII